MKKKSKKVRYSNPQNEEFLHTPIKYRMTCLNVELNSFLQLLFNYFNSIQDGVVYISGIRRNIALNDNESMDIFDNYLLEYINRFSIRKLTINHCKYKIESSKIFAGNQIHYHLDLLTSLSLSGNDINPIGLQALNQCLTKLVHLTELNLSKNRLIGLYFKGNTCYGKLNEIPLYEFFKILDDCRQLRYVDISHNYLGLPNEFDLKYNIYEMISSCLMRNPFIISMIITENDIPDEPTIVNYLLPCIRPTSHGIVSLTGINTSITSNTNITRFDEKPIVLDDVINLSYVGLTPIDGYFIGKELSYYMKSYELDISNNFMFTDVGLNHLVDQLIGSISGSLTMKRINLSHCNLTKDCLLILKKLLDLNSLLSINLSHNQHILSYMFRSSTLYPVDSRIVIADVNLSNCLFNDIENSNSSQHILFPSFHNVKKLDLSCNNLKSRHISSYLDYFGKYNWYETLEDLNLSQNTLDGLCMTMLTTILSNVRCKLRSLDLSYNPLCGSRSTGTFNPLPIFALCDGLRNNNSLQELNLSHCDIGARSTERLLMLTCTNKCLSTLILDYCNISEFGAMHIANALPHTTSLKYLSISNNNIVFDGAKAIIISLTSNQSIEYINLSNNSISGSYIDDFTIQYEEKICAYISDCLKANKTLHTIDLSYNRLFGLNHSKLLSTRDVSLFTAYEVANSIYINRNEGGKLRNINLSGNYMIFCSENSVNTESMSDSCSECILHNHSDSASQMIDKYSNFSYCCYASLTAQLLLSNRLSDITYFDVNTDDSVLTINIYETSDPVVSTDILSYVLLIAREININQNLTQVNIRIGKLKHSHMILLTNILSDHLMIKSFHLNYSLPKDDDIVSSYTQMITSSKLISFEKRVMLAKIIRSFRKFGSIDIIPRLILLYLFGDNRAYRHFIRYV